MRKLNVFLILLIVSLIAVIALVIVGFYLFNASLQNSQGIGGMMGGGSSGAVSNPALSVIFFVLVGVVAVSIGGMVYFLVFPQIKRTSSVTKETVMPLHQHATVSQSSSLAYEAVAKDLTETERKLLDVLVSNDGKCPLENLSQQAGLTKVKTHRIVARLAAKGIILVGTSKSRNIVQLASWLRITTGFAGLDDLLLGGIPENYAVILTSPSIDERQLLIKQFLNSGLKSGQITFYITIDPGTSKALAEEFPLDFYLFVCNSRAEVMVRNLPNVFKLKGIESLTEIDIALTKAFRLLDPARLGPKRACIEILSDVLLQHHAVVTRKWLSGLIPELRSKGFTTIAVLNPQMHPTEDAEAILSLFEGEIRLSVNQTERGEEKALSVTKLYNQKYLENELTLTRRELVSP